MIKKRDEEILHFLQEFGAANAYQIQKLFFPWQKDGIRIANRRLLELTNNNLIRRTRDRYSPRYIYYTGSKSQILHKSYITEFRAKLASSDIQLIEFEREYSIGNLRTDAFAYFKHNGYRYYTFLEVQICNEPLDIAKYELLATHHKIPWPVFPSVIVVSHRNFNIKSRINFIQVGLDYGGWEEVFCHQEDGTRNLIAATRESDSECWFL